MLTVANTTATQTHSTVVQRIFNARIAQLARYIFVALTKGVEWSSTRYTNSQTVGLASIILIRGIPGALQFHLLVIRTGDTRNATANWNTKASAIRSHIRGVAEVAGVVHASISVRTRNGSKASTKDIRRYAGDTGNSVKFKAFVTGAGIRGFIASLGGAGDLGAHPKGTAITANWNTKAPAIRSNKRGFAEVAGVVHASISVRTRNGSKASTKDIRGYAGDTGNSVKFKAFVTGARIRGCFIASGSADLGAHPKGTAITKIEAGLSGAKDAHAPECPEPAIDPPDQSQHVVLGVVRVATRLDTARHRVKQTDGSILRLLQLKLTSSFVVSQPPWCRRHFVGASSSFQAAQPPVGLLRGRNASSSAASSPSEQLFLVARF